MTWTELVVSVCGIFMSPNLDQHILDVSETYEVDKEIILGVIHQESRCNTQAVGGVDRDWETDTTNSVQVMCFLL